MSSCATTSAEWPVAELGELCELAYGKILTKDRLNSEGYPVWSGYSIVGYHSEYMFETPQVSITCRGVGGTGNVHMTPPKAWVTNLAITIIPKDRGVLDKSFLYWAMKASDRSALVTGSAQHQITIGHLAKHRIPLPALADQRRIAHILGPLDDKIELNRQMNRTLETIARTIFKSWFVDFDPVRAKAEGREPIGMDPETAAFFPDSFQDSPLGKIPRGWEATRVCDIATLDKGLSYKGKFLDDAGMPMINLGCFVGDGELRAEKIKGYSGEHKERHLVRPGDVVVANTDMTQKRKILGSPGIVPRVVGARTLLYTHHVYALRLKIPVVDLGRFLYYEFLQPQFRERAEGFATGTTVLALPRDAILEYQFAMPSVELIEAFGQRAGRLLELAAVNEREAASLASVRDVLLPELLPGLLEGLWSSGGDVGCPPSHGGP